MKLSRLAVFLALPGLICCFTSHPIWHDQVLPSGKTVKILSFNLAWGIEHDDRDVNKDCLAIDFVWTDPGADAAVHEKEAREVFELIRPTSELWGLKSAEVLGLPNVDRRVHYVVYDFKRGDDGTWSVNPVQF